ncbi:MAG: hypothetical protein AAGE94_01295 [Acidobacteriota bacterium]
MKTWIRFVLVGAVLACVAQPVMAQDLTGTWVLDASANISGATRGDVGGAVCNFEGTADIVDTAGSLSGDADLALTSGDRSCPLTLSGTLTGTLNGTEIEMGMITDGGGGTATFTGVLGPDRGGAADVAGGGFDVTGGSFSGASGAWNATFAGVTATTDIPTAGVLGMTLLALLLLGAGFVVLRR